MWASGYAGLQSRFAMELLVIPLLSAFVGGITVVSGFGLGTVLMPAFAIVFPLPLAIAATGVVHLVNNVFKLAALGRWADRRVVLQFGVPALFAAVVGASAMALLSRAPVLHAYNFGSLRAEVTLLKLSIAIVLASLAMLELWPRYQRLSLARRWLSAGGVLSGLVGGFSGMQGALRAPFLLRAGLTSQQYIGTANVISTMVDVARLAAYAAGLSLLQGRSGSFADLGEGDLALVGLSCVAACAGSLVSMRVFRKLTFIAIRWMVAILLFASALALGSGVV